MQNPYSPDYAAARARFLTAAESVGCRRETHPLPGRGPNGEELAMDVATLRAEEADARTALLVSSGLHGVEGFFGSAVQSAWLESAPTPPPGMRVVLVHAVNPYGFAWGRRWNENGVDLNRAFLKDRAFLNDDPAYAESRRIYERLSAFLNPASPPSPGEPYLLKAIGVILAQGRAAGASPLAPGRLFAKGLAELKKTLPVGQYEYPGGLFYGGGEEPEWSVRIVRENLRAWIGGAATVIHIDLHTGLGKHGDYKLLIDEAADTEGARWMGERFGARQVESARDGATAYAARGTLLVDCRDRLTASGIAYRGAVVEFGTYSPIRVLGALRAENRAHRYSAPGSPAYAWAQDRIHEVFCPSSPAWRTEALRGGLAVLAAATAG